MLIEIDKDFYCVAGYSQQGDCRGVSNIGQLFCYSSSAAKKDCGSLECRHRKHKHPTPAQFRREYGFDYPDDGAVYCYTFDGGGYSWVAGEYEWAKEYRNDFEPIVCACTPWGKPDKDWRPE